MGTLYTRCIGSLFAKGKYIAPLDSDQMILNFISFDNIYKETNKEYYDIGLYKTICVKTLNDFFNTKNLITHRRHKKTIKIKQPQIGIDGMKSGVIWGKIIKTKIYKKAIKAYGAKRYTNYIILLIV